MVAYAEAQPSVNAKSIAELVVKAAEEISPCRRVRLRSVLTKGLRVEARLFSKVIAKGKGLLAPVAASGTRLTVGLHQGAIHNPWIDG